MNKSILNTGVQIFIEKNINTDIVSLLLKKPIFEQVSNKALATQIASKKKCRKKLPTWFKTPRIYYPPKLNIEQTSSETTARYKSEMVYGKTLVDLTGGFGVDSYFFAQKIETVLHCEIDPYLAEIVSANFKVLRAENISMISGDGIRFLKKSKQRFDWLYIDPSRRNDQKGKVFHLSDCIPNVTEHFDLFFSCADNILLKTAPFLDITAAIKDLHGVQELHIVALNGEVKELLWLLGNERLADIRVKTVNLGLSHHQTFDFLLQEEKSAISSFDIPLQYLYEPNAAILKSGAFKAIGQKYSLAKLHRHTHLYTSKELVDFPGRRFEINKCLPFDKKAGATLKGLKANIASRNFPKSIQDIKKKYKIRDGGEIYLFFITDLHDKLMVLFCKKVDV